jgi:hypothetical protein
MKTEPTELFDLALLRLLDTNRTRYGLSLVALGHHLRAFGFSPASAGGAEAFHDQLADRIEYLTNKGMVEEVTKTLNRENRAWRIRSAGIRYVDERE